VYTTLRIEENITSGCHYIAYHTFIPNITTVLFRTWKQIRMRDETLTLKSR